MCILCSWVQTLRARRTRSLNTLTSKKQQISTLPIQSFYQSSLIRCFRIDISIVMLWPANYFHRSCKLTGNWLNSGELLIFHLVVNIAYCMITFLKIPNKRITSQIWDLPDENFYDRMFSGSGKRIRPESPPKNQSTNQKNYYECTSLLC